MEKTLFVAAFCLTLLPLTQALYFNTTPTTCKTVCESEHCKDPVRLKYGKYCGVGYTGCSGQSPCDGLDACCQTHDNCVGSNNLKNYVDTQCSNALLNCVETWDASNSAQFAGNTCPREDVVNTISGVMKLATIDGRLGNAATTATTILSPISILGAVLFIHLFVYQ
ncbi:secretory phospholipase A2 [Marchantia polymorpha subsp. ruderalis]|uniref:Uncharacterized protein n=2 Tax=Marchantia polymorpha TaxID=3197 RepID=A0A176WBC0_MARPO|nr:hypothetical protein AXG93_509s1350 [Marchantia polymorpha subsp. ruderalis]PTQ37250.1 hypothetical protein MARPO_0058s0039 [Marchantia polymorpha]BBN12498.1 hypothetical protein Mp_5g20610 [Marchantia polymorpha subsp. ruderalis]|eukprot:PTQ37250.1 hypothetical protein MARPO_0058s0039 [Marchantia polymorpha]